MTTNRRPRQTEHMASVQSSYQVGLLTRVMLTQATRAQPHALPMGVDGALHGTLHELSR